MFLPLTIHTTFQHSSSLHDLIEQRVRRAVRPFAGTLARAEVRLSDANAQKHGPADKVVRIVLVMSRGGRLVVSAASDDFYASVVRAASRAKAALARHVTSRRTRASKGRIDG